MNITRRLFIRKISLCAHFVGNFVGFKIVYMNFIVELTDNEIFFDKNTTVLVS